MTDKKADLAGPGIGNYEELEKNPAPELPLDIDDKGNPTGHLCRQKLYRRKSVQGT